jgi:hypothetical protein
MLKPLGIEKGKPIQPDEREKRILTEGAFVGEAIANFLDMRFPGVRYRPDALWDYFLMLEPIEDLANYRQLDERTACFYAALGVTKGMLSKSRGVGQAGTQSITRKGPAPITRAASRRSRWPRMFIACACCAMWSATRCAPG